jgi:hypothetical protein
VEVTGRALIALAAVLAVAGCSGSGPSPEKAFVADVQSICADAASRQPPQATPHPTVEATLKALRTQWAATDRTLADLGALEPPDSTGVSAAAWSEAFAQARRDGRAYEQFYERQYPVLVRSFQRGNAAPSGTGPSAAALAQVFNAAAGRRFLHRQSALVDKLNADAKALDRVGKKVGTALGNANLTRCDSTAPAATTTGP